LWGGIEATVARIGDRFRDQSIATGHRDRLDDLDRIAALGIRTLRYPVVWETVAPDRPDRFDWAWHDERLGRARQLGIRPIAGLLHHGSGPAYSNLLDPAFPDLFAAYARRVAERYPWIDLYTPVNEPLTTARFSALYGHWYPHRTDYRAFLTALVAQCAATVLGMRAIRAVNPAAQLIQTDDLGRTFSTPALADRAEHENERRWLTFDLLCGRVDSHHSWWPIFREHGISERSLALFLEGDGAPDIMGINHYLTSERFLDERLNRYPEHLRGHNGHVAYADVEAVRMPLPAEQIGPAARLTELWERYRRPIAVTEVHHGCTRDEQLRWLAEVWRAAETVRASGADIRAVTIWALFGTMDWNSLLTRESGVYEPGVYDVRGQTPRPTALAAAARSLGISGTFDHPVLDRPGWWRRNTRFYRPAVEARAPADPSGPRTLAIVGTDGPLAEAFARIAAQRGLDATSMTPAQLSRLVRPGSGAGQLPWAIVDSEGLVPDGLAATLIERGTAYVRITQPAPDGALGRAYLEADLPEPGAPAGTLVIRTGPQFGPWDQENFAWKALQRLASGRPVAARAETISVTYLPDLVHVSLDLLIDGEQGVWHLTNPGEVTWHALLETLAGRVALPLDFEQLGLEHPRNLALDTGRGRLMPPLASALDRFVDGADAGWRAQGPIFVAAAE
jgi:dTDP-4-dehydrorhamnose reductase